MRYSPIALSKSKLSAEIMMLARSRELMASTIVQGGVLGGWCPALMGSAATSSKIPRLMRERFFDRMAWLWGLALARQSDCSRLISVAPAAQAHALQFLLFIDQLVLQRTDDVQQQQGNHQPSAQAVPCHELLV